MKTTPLTTIAQRAGVTDEAAERAARRHGYRIHDTSSGPAIWSRYASGVQAELVRQAMACTNAPDREAYLRAVADKEPWVPRFAAQRRCA